MGCFSCGLPRCSRHLPTHQVSRLSLSCCESCHRESCSWKSGKQSNISSGTGILVLPPAAVADNILGKCHPISGVPFVFKRCHSVLFNFKDFAGISERTRWRIVRWFGVLWLSLNPHGRSSPFTLCLPSRAPGYLSQFLYLPALHSFLSSSQGAQASGTTIP